MAGEKDLLPTSENAPGRESPKMHPVSPSRRWHYPLIFLCAGLFLFLNNFHTEKTPHSIEERVDKILTETPLIGRLCDVVTAHSFYREN